MKSIHVKVKLKNGIALNCLRFIEDMPQADAENEAINIVCGQHKGTVDYVCITDEPLLNNK